MTAPTGVRNYSNTAAGATLTAAAGATDTTLALSTVTGDPTVPFTAALSRGTANEEVILVTAIIGSNATVQRGFDGTTAKAQSAGATFQEVVVALDFREANNHLNASSSVHGTTSAVVGTTDTQTLTNKTLTSPTISNPTITGTSTVATSSVTTLNVSGVSSLTTLNVSGAATVTGALTASSTLAVTGLLTASGGITVPTGKKITLTDAPAASTDGVNKAYVDPLVAGAWATPATQSVANFAAGTGWPPLSYRAEGNGLVRVRGGLTNATVTQGQVLFTLPAGFTPASNGLLLCATPSGVIALYVLPSGDVTFSAAGTYGNFLINATFALN